MRLRCATATTFYVASGRYSGRYDDTARCRDATLRCSIRISCSAAARTGISCSFSCILFPCIRVVQPGTKATQSNATLQLSRNGDAQHRAITELTAGALGATHSSKPITGIRADLLQTPPGKLDNIADLPQQASPGRLDNIADWCSENERRPGECREEDSKLEHRETKLGRCGFSTGRMSRTST